MTATHPKLVEILVDQTPRAMIAMLIVSSAYIWIFYRFAPFYILFTWFSLQILLALYRFHNAKNFKKSIENNDPEKTKQNEVAFIISNIFQATMWTASSVIAIIYAPQPFELVIFVMVIGIITAAALSMSSLYKAYLVFFFLMITPQVIVLIYYGDHQHISLVVLTIIYIPATILLSKAIYNSRLSNIEAHYDLESSIDELHRLSTIDNLTNIYNRRYFFKVSEAAIETALAEKHDVSLLMIDIDYFKKINDNYGHLTGDFILTNLVKEIQKSMRSSDIFARIGGEEFTILLNNTSIYSAENIADKIRKIIENKTFYYNNDQINVTISIGLSALNSENRSIEDLYQRADKQLYIAKINGRNRVSS